MWVSKVRIRNFRSIPDMTLPLCKDLTLLVGPNSCGKSNVLRALELAFREEGPWSPQAVRDSLSTELLESPGAPKASVWVDVSFEECPYDVRVLGGDPNANGQRYTYRLYRSGRIARSLAGKALDDAGFAELRKRIQVVYVPPIRDITAGGLDPFLELLRDAINRARGDRSLESVKTSAERILSGQADKIFAGQRSIVRGLMHATDLVLDTGHLSLDALYKNLRVSARFSDGRLVPLEKLGTGHQSTVVLGLYRQLTGSSGSGGYNLLCLEEPDNHLHPASVRALGTELLNIADSSQVIATTHSPVLINHVGLHHVRSMFLDEDHRTTLRRSTIEQYTEAQLSSLAQTHMLRTSEPLLSRKTVLVEGPSDACVFSRLIRHLTRNSPEHLDILIVPCGGKQGVVRLARLLQDLGVEWIAIVDDDTLYSGRTPVTRDGVSDAEKSAGLNAVRQLKTICDGTTRKGREMLTALEHLESELESGRQATPAGTSVFEQLLEIRGVPSPTTRTELVASLRQTAHNRKGALEDYSIAVLSGTLEEVLLRQENAEKVAEEILVTKANLARRPAGLHNAASRRREVVGRLHNVDLVILAEIVDSLYEEGLLSRSELARTARFIVKQASRSTHIP